MSKETESEDSDATASERKPKSTALKTKRVRPNRDKQPHKLQGSNRKVSPRPEVLEDLGILPTTTYIKNLKGKRKIVGLTAYDTILGAAVSAANVDFILVGDSLGTTLLGYDTTISVT